MRLRGLLIAVIALAALGGLAWWSEKDKAAEATKPAKDAPPKLIQVPEDQISRIEIRKRGADPIQLQRNSSNKWEMTAPKPERTDQDAANGIATALASLNSDKLVDEKPADLSAFGLVTPAVDVILTKKDGKTVGLQIGDEAPVGGAFYAKLAGDAKLYTIASFAKSGIDRSLEDLRDKRLLTFDTDKLTRVEIDARKQPVEFGRNNNNEWQILKPKPMRADSFQVEELVRRLKEAQVDSSASDVAKAPAAFAAAAPVAVAKVTDASGTQSLEVRKTKDGAWYAKSSVSAAPRKIAKDLGEGLDKGLEDFRNKKLYDFGFAEPGKVEVKGGGQFWSFSKSGEKWFHNGKEMDATGVQALISKLRDLAATGFAESGSAGSDLETTVSWNEGKRSDKVAFSKAGDKIFGRRENEPTLYQLDGKTIDEILKAAGDVKPAQAAKDEKKK